MRVLATLGSLASATVLVAGCALVSDMSPGQLVNDMTMTTTVKSRLAATEGMASLTNLHVRTASDIVYLTGTVKDEDTRARIDKTVRSVAGDNRVANQLQVEGGRSEARTR
jgi:osmotically-inducible protein OsmY